MSAVATSLQTDAAPQRFSVRPFEAPLGAEIVGLDLSQPLNDSDFIRIHQAHLDHGLLVFRDQQITPEQQISFSAVLASCRFMCSWVDGELATLGQEKFLLKLYDQYVRKDLADDTDPASVIVEGGKWQ